MPKSFVGVFLESGGPSSFHEGDRRLIGGHLEYEALRFCWDSFLGRNLRSIFAGLCCCRAAIR